MDGEDNTKADTKQNTVKSWTVSNFFCKRSARQANISINFNLINEQYLVIQIVRDT